MSKRSSICTALKYIMYRIQNTQEAFVLNGMLALSMSINTLAIAQALCHVVMGGLIAATTVEKFDINLRLLALSSCRRNILA